MLPVEPVVVRVHGLPVQFRVAGLPDPSERVTARLAEEDAETLRGVPISVFNATDTGRGFRVIT